MVFLFRVYALVLMIMAGITAQEKLSANPPLGGKKDSSLSDTSVNKSVSTFPLATEKKDAIFFHPIISGLSVAIDAIPFVFVLTYEHQLPDSKSFILQNQLLLGSFKPDSGYSASTYGLYTYFGLRNYFNPHYHRGFYLQGTAAVGLQHIDIEREGYTGEASAFATTLAGLAYLGYRWSHVFWDIGGGYQYSNGSVDAPGGATVDISASGPALDLNLGFCF